VANVASMFQTIEYFVKEHGINDITINQINGHKYLRARHAPVDIKKQSQKQLDMLLASGLIEEKSNAWYNIARCSQELEITEVDPSGYVEYFDHLDQLRGTNWRQIFPELVL
jgi:hypothetical protein